MYVIVLETINQGSREHPYVIQIMETKCEFLNYSDNCEHCM